MISADDIGAVAAECLLNHKKFSGQAVLLAADDLDIEQVADAYEASGRPRPDTQPVPKEVMDGLPEDMKLMFKVSIPHESFYLSCSRRHVLFPVHL